MRPNWDGSGPRPLSWVAWYPSAHDAVEQDLRATDTTAAWFSFDRPHATRRRAKPSALPDRDAVARHRRHGDASRLARPAISPGAASSRSASTITAIRPPNRYRAEGFLAWWERARDLTLLLDVLATHGEFAGRIDTDRAFVVGYSLGGCTAAALLGAITETSTIRTLSEEQEFRPVARANSPTSRTTAGPAGEQRRFSQVLGAHVGLLPAISGFKADADAGARQFRTGLQRTACARSRRRHELWSAVRTSCCRSRPGCTSAWRRTSLSCSAPEQSALCSFSRKPRTTVAEPARMLHRCIRCRPRLGARPRRGATAEFFQSS